MVNYTNSMFLYKNMTQNGFAKSTNLPNDFNNYKIHNILICYLTSICYTRQIEQLY